MGTDERGGETFAPGSALERADVGFKGRNGFTVEGQRARLRPDSVLEMEGSGELRATIDGDEVAIDGDQVALVRTRHGTRCTDTAHGEAAWTNRKPIPRGNAPHGGVGIPAGSVKAIPAVARNPDPAVAVKEV